jgi:hypothetical protein
VKTRIVCFGKDITETRATTPKTVLGSIPDEDVFSTLETNDGRRTKIRSALFVSARTLQEQRPQPQNVFWVVFF